MVLRMKVWNTFWPLYVGECYESQVFRVNYMWTLLAVIIDSSSIHLEVRMTTYLILSCKLYQISLAHSFNDGGVINYSISMTTVIDSGENTHRYI